MARISISEAREKFAELVSLSRREPVVLQKRGEDTAVMVSPERYEEMLQAEEEVADIAAFDEAMAEEGENISLEQAKADLGWS
ncbi:MAG: type II toxin-antitoxin system Phd/YefM family antitoxin [bacterium]